jgi:hypothetical protein
MRKIRFAALGTILFFIACRPALDAAAVAARATEYQIDLERCEQDSKSCQEYLDCLQRADDRAGVKDAGYTVVCTESRVEDAAAPAADAFRPARNDEW